MEPSRILIIGASGQLGTALKDHYPEARAVTSREFDLTNKAAIDAYDWSGIDVILNAAAYTNVDGAETAEGRVAAWQLNAVAPAHLAAVANRHDITLVHISSDYVFDGTAAVHTEDEPFSPLGVYGQSKAAGDIAVGLASKHYVLRTSWVIGEGKNFVRTMLSLADRDISPTVVGDQVGRLTFTSELVKAIDHLLAGSAPFGTYDVSNSGQAVSWADITRRIFALAGRGDLTVTDTTTEEYFASKPDIAPRPLQSVLSLDKLQATGFDSTDWETDLQTYVTKETA